MLAHGDLGIGTFDGLDGELVVLDGRAFRITGHEHVARAGEDELTPYAAVTRFAPGDAVGLPECGDLGDLTDALDGLRQDDRHVVAVRVDGRFDRVSLRVACGAREGETLARAAGRQHEATHRGVEGTLVGFWSPRELLGIDVVGYHLHLLSDDRRVGGHVFDIAGRGLVARVQIEGVVRVVGAPSAPIDPRTLARDLGTAEG